MVSASARLPGGNPQVKISVSCHSARVLQRSPTRKTAGNQHQARIHGIGRVLCDAVDILLAAPVEHVLLDPKGIQYSVLVEKVETHVAPGKRVVVRSREAAGHASIYRTQCRESRTVLNQTQTRRRTRSS